MQPTSLFISLPCFGGMMSAGTSSAIFKLQDWLYDHQVGSVLSQLSNESCLPKGRNTLASHYLASPCSHWLMVDADIEFEPLQIERLFQHDKEIIGLPYAKKKLAWPTIIQAVRHSPEVTAEDLQRINGTSTLTPLQSQVEVRFGEPIAVRSMGLGCLLVQRSVIETLDARARQEDRWYHDPDLKRDVADLFPTGVYDRHYQQEDTGFFRLCREAGYTVWINPWDGVRHWGTHSYEMNLAAATILTRGAAEVTSEPRNEIQG